MSLRLAKGSRDRISDELKFAASTDSGRIFVIPNFSGWTLRREGSLKAYRNYASKDLAVEGAKQYQIEHGGVIFIHAQDGSYQKNY